MDKDSRPLYDSNTTRGRKKSAAPALTKRQAQVREGALVALAIRPTDCLLPPLAFRLKAQQALRNRKQQYIRNLEADVAALKAELAALRSGSIGSHDGQLHPRAPAGTDSADVASELARLRSECAQLSDALLQYKAINPNIQCASCVAEKARSSMLLQQLDALQLRVVSQDMQIARLAGNGDVTSVLGASPPDPVMAFSLNWLPPPAQTPATSNASLPSLFDPTICSASFDPFSQSAHSPSAATGNDMGHPLLNAISASDSNDMDWLDLIMTDPNVDPSSSSGPATTGSSSTPKPRVKRSASELFGQPEVEFLRIALLSLPFVNANPGLLNVLDVFVTQSNSTNPKTVKRCLREIYGYCRTFFSLASQQERFKCYELLFLFMERNKRHIEYLHGKTPSGIMRDLTAIPTASDSQPSTSATDPNNFLSQSVPINSKVEVSVPFSTAEVSSDSSSPAASIAASAVSSASSLSPSSSSSHVRERSVSLSPEGSKFKKMLYSLPSLKDSTNIIDNLCDLIEIFTLNSESATIAMAAPPSVIAAASEEIEFEICQLEFQLVTRLKTPAEVDEFMSEKENIKDGVKWKRFS
ncbi:hypothetical protein HDU82_009087 [Entophlyctis luteolus]|nr:hypothetical protein HDU82_009087 [Entophlyctis luteolus]